MTKPKKSKSFIPICPICEKMLFVLTETTAGEYDGMYFQWAYYHCSDHNDEPVAVAQIARSGAIKHIEYYKGRMTKAEIVHYYGSYDGGRKNCPIDKSDELQYLARCRPDGLTFEIKTPAESEYSMILKILDELSKSKKTVRIEVID